MARAANNFEELKNGRVAMLATMGVPAAAMSDVAACCRCLLSLRSPLLSFNTRPCSNLWVEKNHSRRVDWAKEKAPSLVVTFAGCTFV